MFLLFAAEHSALITQVGVLDSSKCQSRCLHSISNRFIYRSCHLAWLLKIVVKKIKMFSNANKTSKLIMLKIQLNNTEKLAYLDIIFTSIFSKAAGAINGVQACIGVSCTGLFEVSYQVVRPSHIDFFLYIILK